MSNRAIKFFFGVIIAGGLTTVVFFNNCSKSSFDTIRDDSSFVIASTIDDGSVDNDYFVSCIPKTSSKLVTTTLSSEIKYSPDILTDTMVSKDTTLVVKVDHKCLSTNNKLSPISMALKNRPQGLILDLEFGSYKYNLTESLSKIQFEELINSDECISFVDKNNTYYISSAGDINDVYYANQDHLTAIAHKDIYKNIFNSMNGINKEVRVAIIDSGVDTSNPDLINNMLRDTSEQVIGLNALSNNKNVADSGFHGTHVAGITAASSGNGIGISGVLGASIKIIPIRVSNDGSSVDLDAVINGINWAAKQKADVINMSLSAKGAKGDRPLLREAIDFAIKSGTTIVVAAGNDGQVITQNSNLVPMKDCSGNYYKDANGNIIGMDTAHVYPMKYASSINGLISVGSVDAITGLLSCFSNRSPEFVEILAPGSASTIGIISTVPSIISNLGYANKYNGSPINGTSMSSPVVAGAAAMTIALARSRGYSALPEQVEKLLTKGAIQDPTLTSYAKNGQKLNLKSLVNLIDQDTHLQTSSTIDRSNAYGNIVIAQQPENKKVVLGEKVDLELTLNESSSILINYQWYRNGRVITGANSRTLSIPKVMASHAGTYQVVLSAGKTKISSSTATLVVGSQYCN